MNSREQLSTQPVGVDCPRLAIEESGQAVGGRAEKGEEAEVAPTGSG